MNGFANYETWNAALWVGNDEFLYNTAKAQNDEGLYSASKECRTYQDLVSMLWECGSKETPDGVRWDDPAIDGLEINEMMAEL